MRTHIILDGIVTNTIMASVADAQRAYPHALCVDGSTGGIGWTWDGSALTPPLQNVDLPTAKKAKLAQILAASDAAFEAAAATYSNGERLSWPKQEAEARALLADPDAPAPLLRGIAAARGVGLTDLRDRVLTKVTEYETVCATILGTQQRYEDAVGAASSVADVEAIRVDFTGVIDG